MNPEDLSAAVRDFLFSIVEDFGAIRVRLMKDFCDLGDRNDSAGIDQRCKLARQLRETGQAQLDALEVWMNLQVPGIQIQVRPPSMIAFKAYHLHIELGHVQSDVASLLSNELERTVHQGQVSKLCKEVQQYLGAGGQLPQADKLRQPLQLDVQLDVGPRRDGRAQHQRPRRDESD